VTFVDIRVNTIKHAMIAQLQNPSAGFEDVIKAHFYLKKERILQVCFKLLGSCVMLLYYF
jgi:hypothetical protein